MWIVSLVFMVVGCAGRPERLVPDCRLSSECPPGSSCVEGRCAVECREDRDCEPDARCDLARGACVLVVAPEADAGGARDADAARDDSGKAAEVAEGGGGAEDLPGTLPLAGGPGDDWRPPRELLVDCAFLPQASPPEYGDWSRTRLCGPTSLAVAVRCLEHGVPTVADLRGLDAWLAANVDGYDPLPALNGDYTSVVDLVEAASGYFGQGATSTNELELSDLFAELEAGRPPIVAVETQCQAVAGGGCSNNAPADVMRRGEAHFAVLVGLSTTHVVLHDVGRSPPNGANRRFTLGSFLTVWNRHGRWAVTFGPPAPCTDACTSEGATSCADAFTLQRCARGADGCLAQLPLETCDACVAGTCCTNACPFDGATRCEAGVAWTCATPAGAACRAWTSPTTCALGCDGPRCATGTCTPGTSVSCTAPSGVPGTQVCESSREWGPCRGSEVCNGLDDDGNGIVDDPGSCFSTVYRHRTNRGWALEARCYSTSPVPAGVCAGFVAEREAFVLATAAGPGRIELLQCSAPPGSDGVRLDHIIVPQGSADEASLRAAGFLCEQLGWAWALGTTAATPFTGATSCPLWRWSFTAAPGVGAHLFSATPELTRDLTCEPPARAVVVVPSGSCFPGTPPGC